MAVRVPRGGGFLKQNACRAQLRYNVGRSAETPQTETSELGQVQWSAKGADGQPTQGWPERKPAGQAEQMKMMAGAREGRQDPPAATGADREAETGPTQGRKGHTATLPRDGTWGHKSHPASGTPERAQAEEEVQAEPEERAHERHPQTEMAMTGGLPLAKEQPDGRPGRPGPRKNQCWQNTG